MVISPLISNILSGEIFKIRDAVASSLKSFLNLRLSNVPTVAFFSAEMLDFPLIRLKSKVLVASI